MFRLHSKLLFSHVIYVTRNGRRDYQCTVQLVRVFEAVGPLHRVMVIFYVSTGVHYLVQQLKPTVWLDGISQGFHVTPEKVVQRRKNLVISLTKQLGPIQLSRKCWWLRNGITCLPKLGGAPSCYRHISWLLSREHLHHQRQLLL
jgi:hypothetical protein